MLHSLQKSRSPTARQAFARRVAVAMPVELGVFPPLSAKDLRMEWLLRVELNGLAG